MNFKLGDRATDYLVRDKRELMRVRSTIETYKRERGKLADLSNVGDIAMLLDKLIPLLEQEIETSKDYERWLKDE